MSGLRRKAIKSVLTRKHKEWAESIEDEGVRKLVKKNSIITGGAITSMLLGEKPNDFDVYFTDRETVKEVAQYYLKKFIEDHPEYKASILRMREDGRIEFVVAGNRSVIGDSPEPDEETEDAFLDDEPDEQEGRPKYSPVFLTTNAISLTGRIQIVIRFYGEPDEIHKNFDFIHTTCYWRSENGHLELPAAALEATLAKELTYIGSLYPICSLFRTRKFICRGWQINAGQFVKMAWQISKLDLTNIDILRDQLVGVDSLYFEQVIENLKSKQESDPDYKVDASYLFEIINRIF